MWAVDVVLRLWEDWSACLAKLAHAVVKREAVGGLWHVVPTHVVLRLLSAWSAIVMVLGCVRGEVVERVGEIGQLWGSTLTEFAVVVGKLGEVDVEVVKVD